MGEGGADEIIGMSLTVMDPEHSSLELSSKTELTPKRSALTPLHFGFQCNLFLTNLGHRKRGGKNSSSFGNIFQNKHDANDFGFRTENSSVGIQNVIQIYKL
jgi:hypothetical protein